MKKRYGISWPYRTRNVYHHHDDRELKDEWQDEVYLHAAQIAQEYKYSNVIDVGCGSGFKLAKHFQSLNTLGLELPPQLEFLQNKYPNMCWQESDFDQPIQFESEIAICADVIEHLVDPDLLLQFLHSLNAQHYVLSTPDRSLLYKPWKRRFWGPPRNPSHQREWTFREFRRYISGTFKVLDHKITRRDQATQMIVCSRY